MANGQPNLKKEKAKLPQARRYLMAANWGLETLVDQRLSGIPCFFHMIGILSALRSVQHMLLSHDRLLSTEHDRVISAWAKETKDTASIEPLHFIKASRDLILKEGKFAFQTIHGEIEVELDGKRESVSHIFAMSYQPDGRKSRPHDLESDIRLAISWCEGQLEKIEAQLPPLGEGSVIPQK
jgi:hypothetical protein